MGEFKLYFKANKSFVPLLWVICLASLSFVPTLFISHVGEEGVYTISSLEMLSNKNYINATLFGNSYPRPPLYNWLIVGITALLGIPYVLIAARLVTMFATLGIAFGVAWMVQQFWKQHFLSLLTAAIFLSGDVLLRRGWLAYSDPVFTFFVFLSMAFLWLAVDKSRCLWLIPAIVCLCLGSLAKVYTIYAFYGITGLVLLWRYPHSWKFLFSPVSMIIHVFALAFPIWWMMYISSSSVFTSTLSDVWRLLNYNMGFEYIKKVTLYPIELIIRLLPTSIIVIYYLFIYNKKDKKLHYNNHIITTFFIVIANILPYWLSPISRVRYIMPLYPFFSVIMAYIIFNSNKTIIKQTINCLFIFIIIKYLLAFFWFPYDQTVRHGDAKFIAKNIIEKTKDTPLYCNATTSQGLRIGVEIDLLQNKKMLLKSIGKNYNGYVIMDELNPSFGQLIATYALGSKSIYLMCQGINCIN